MLEWLISHVINMLQWLISNNMIAERVERPTDLSIRVSTDLLADWLTDQLIG